MLFDARVLSGPCGAGEYWGNLFATLRRLQPSLFITVVARSERSLNESLRLAANEITTSRLPYLLPGRLAMSQILGSVRPDVYINALFYTPAYLKSVYIVSSVFDVIYDREPMSIHRQFAYKFFMRRALRKSDVVITASDASMADIARFYPPLSYGSSRAIVSPALPNLDPSVQVVRSYRSLLIIGSDKPHKRVERLLASLKPVIEDGWSVHVIGIFETAIDLTGVVFEGLVSDSRKNELLASCTFLLSASTDEGFGLPVLEAMYAGCVPVVTNIPSHREICGNGCGVLIDVDELDSVSEVLQRLDPEWVLKQSELSRVRASSWSMSGARVMLGIFGEISGA